MNFNPFAENKIPSVSMFSKKLPEKKSIVASNQEVDTLDEEYSIKEYLGVKMNGETRRFFKELSTQIGENQVQNFLPYGGGFSTFDKEGQLLMLVCAGNSIIRLPPFPSGLLQINCQNTLITTLPELPEGLEWLHCPHNSKLSLLPKLPASLEKLNCNLTRVATLPELPQNLQLLSIQGAPIATLPNIPKDLRAISYSGTPLAMNTDYINEIKQAHPNIKITN